MIDHTSAIAYGLASVIALFVVGALLWILFLPIVNAPVGGLNDLGAGAHASRQTFATFTIAQTMYNYGIPILVLLIGFYYGIDRALLKRKEEGYG